MCISSKGKYLTNAKNITNPNDCVLQQKMYMGKDFSFNQVVQNNLTCLHNDFIFSDYTIIWNRTLISYLRNIYDMPKLLFYHLIYTNNTVFFFLNLICFLIISETLPPLHLSSNLNS